MILMKWLYRLPQKKKFSGVMIGDMAVVVAVSETDKAMLPFESADRKFDTLNSYELCTKCKGEIK